MDDIGIVYPCKVYNYMLIISPYSDFSDKYPNVEVIGTDLSPM